jgi:curved DNA-binding protein CbpA
VLGVPEGASADEVDQAFREKAKQIHPDMPGGNETAM